MNIILIIFFVLIMFYHPPFLYILPGTPCSWSGGRNICLDLSPPIWDHGWSVWGPWHGHEEEAFKLAGWWSWLDTGQSSANFPNWRAVGISSHCRIETIQISTHNRVSPEECAEIIAKVDRTLQHLVLNTFTYPQLRPMPGRLRKLHLGPSMTCTDISGAIQHFSRVPALREIEIRRYVDGIEILH